MLNLRPPCSLTQLLTFEVELCQPFNVAGSNQLKPRLVFHAFCKGKLCFLRFFGNANAESMKPTFLESSTTSPPGEHNWAPMSCHILLLYTCFQSNWLQYSVVPVRWFCVQAHAFQSRDRVNTYLCESVCDVYSFNGHATGSLWWWSTCSENKYAAHGIMLNICIW